MNNNETLVNGFLFEDENVREEALKEQEAISYINKELDFSNVESILQLYNSMIERDMFHTEVGYNYLKQIQDYLLKSNVDSRRISGIVIKNNSSKNMDMLEKANTKKSNKSHLIMKSKLKKYKTIIISLIVIIIVLVLTVISLFIIQGTSTNPTIINYEKKIQDKYASWEQELTEREDQLNRRTR